MDKQKFYTYWNEIFANVLPISHLFKTSFSGRWFRIHSLPNSKRYAKNKKERDFLLTRQNQIISDLFGENSEILVVIGQYNDSENAAFVLNKLEIYKSLDFITLNAINLFEVFGGDDYDENQTYQPAFASAKWHSNGFNDLLMEIAEDRIRAFFINVEKNIIVAPYDGGIDFILKDVETKEMYKRKYEDWLSKRSDGF